MMFCTRRTARWLLPAPLAISFAFGLTAHAAAQLPTMPSARFRGEIGSFGEMYSASGREQRRPSSTGRLFMRSTLELGSVNVGLDLLYSTEGNSGVRLGSSGRQSMNQLSIAPQWRWGRAYVGSFIDSYSSLTWDGLRVRGAGFNINPGPLRLAAFHGRAQDAVAGGAVDGAYKRSLSGARIGYGRNLDSRNDGFVDIVLLRAADDPSSLAQAPGTVPAANVTTNTFAVTPEENLVVAAVTRVPLWRGQLLWSGEVAASLHARDRRAPVLSDQALDDYVGLLRSEIKPRASTYGDIAHKGQLELRNLSLPGATAQSPRTLSASVGYRYIGAGYVSLGVATLPADQQAVTAMASARFRTWNASLQAMQQHDNLLGQKLATTNRSRFAGSLNLRPSRLLNAAVRLSLNTVANNAAEPNRRVDYSSWNVGTSFTLNTAGKQVLRSVALNYGYQEAGDDNELRVGSELSAHDANIRPTLELFPNLSLIPAIGVSATRPADSSWQLRQTYAVTGQHRALRGRLSSTVSLSNSRLNEGGAIQGGIASRYRLTTSDMVTLSVRHNRVTGLPTSTGRFVENTVNVQWARTIQ